MDITNHFKIMYLAQKIQQTPQLSQFPKEPQTFQKTEYTQIKLT